MSTPSVLDLSFTTSEIVTKYNSRINIIIKGLKFKESHVLENTKL
jgi:hypothetical protein